MPATTKKKSKPEARSQGYRTIEIDDLFSPLTSAAEGIDSKLSLVLDNTSCIGKAQIKTDKRVSAIERITNGTAGLVALYVLYSIAKAFGLI